MANVKKYKIIDGGFSNETKFIEVKYDFDKDAGAIGVLNLFKADENMVITRVSAHVDTGVTSAGAPAIDVGIVGGDTDALFKDVAKGSLGIGVVYRDSADEVIPLKVAKDAYIAMEIKTAALTAGVIRFRFQVEKF